MKKELDIIIPISLDLDWPTFEEMTGSILELYENYGFKRFALAAPCGGWRAVGYPPREFFKDRAELFLSVKNALLPYGIECGWWITATLKSGHSDEFTAFVREVGGESPFHNCPLDKAFMKRFSEDVAVFAKIAKPAFIITEDDYTVSTGCFCKLHLEEFARREGRYYPREELLEHFASDTCEGYKLLRRWRELSKDSLVELACAIRQAVDEESPEIPIGYMQSGTTDHEGYSTEAIARALAGGRHIPFSRIFAAPYCGTEAKEIPRELYHALYSVQRAQRGGNFHCYHESDTFPHTRFFMSGKMMKTIMANAYSFGMMGSTFNLQQLVDDPNEEKTYARMFSEERERFNSLHIAVQNCRIKGVQLCYDPFWNTADKSVSEIYPLWTKCLALFGIPYTTEEASVAFWDVRQAKYADEETVLKYLSKGLFLDGEAAKVLCERGFGEYLGVEVEGYADTEPICYDLAAREVICEAFRTEGKGCNMPSSHMYAVGRNGRLFTLAVTNPQVEVISEEYTYKKELVTPVMTRFINKLGGKIVVMGQTLDGNNSQSLLNYRRKRLFEKLLLWCSDEYLFVREEPNLYTVVNESDDVEKNRCLGVVTITNLSADPVSDATLHLPKQWENAREFYLLDADGQWKKRNCIVENRELTLDFTLEYCEPAYLLIK